MRLLFVMALRNAMVAVAAGDVERNDDGAGRCECREPFSDSAELDAPVADEARPLRQ